MANSPTPRVLVGPRSLNRRICRLMYVRETDEVWTEAWENDAWVRTPVLMRLVLKAPVTTHSTLNRRGVPREMGEWDRELRN